MFIQRSSLPSSRDQNTTISHPSTLKRVKRLTDPLNTERESLDHGPDIVDGSKREHLAVNLASRDQTALDLQAAHDNRHVRDFQVVVGDAERVDGTGGRHDRKVQVPVRLL